MENIELKYPSFFVDFAGNWYYGFKDKYLIYDSKASNFTNAKLINQQPTKPTCDILGYYWGWDL